MVLLKKTERRKYMRLQSPEPLTVKFYTPILWGCIHKCAVTNGILNNISASGLCLNYQAKKLKSAEAAFMSIAFPKMCLQIQAIRYNIIWDFVCPSADRFNSWRVCGVQFSDLSAEQSGCIEKILQHADALPPSRS